MASLRGIAALTAGAATAGAAMGLADVGTVFSLVLGVVVWGGTALALAPAGSPGRLRGAWTRDTGAERLAGELQEAAERVRRLRKRRDRLPFSRIADSVERICDHAEAILAEQAGSPRGYRRVRKPLVQYLSHVETIVARLEDIGARHGLDEDTRRRAEQMLSDLERIFVDYARRADPGDVLDLDARMALLEAEIAAEGIDGVGRAGR